MARDGLTIDALSVCLAMGIVVATGVVFWYASRRRRPRPPFLNKTRQTVRLMERQDMSRDTVLFRFALDYPDQPLGLPCGMHFKVFCPNPPGKVPGQWNTREDPETSLVEIERKYTPVTGDDTLGHVDLLIKVYRGGELEKFPDGGKVSQYMGNLKVGDRLTISGPWGLITYKGRGVFMSGSKRLEAREVGMMAGGTGLTPMLQIIRGVLKDPEDPTKLSLIYANQTPGDILCREELDALAARHPSRFRLWYTVDHPDAPWRFDTGFITREMIHDHQPPPAEGTLILLCGPPPMVKFACKDNLAVLGYSPASILTF